METGHRIRLVMLLMAVLLSAHSAMAVHWVCGKVNNSVDSYDAAWMIVNAYYVGDRNNYESCEIGPEDNMYCCDAESIPGHAWKIGDVIKAEVPAAYNHLASPVSVRTTGEGYDLMPGMQLMPIVWIKEPESKVYNSAAVNLSIESLYTARISYSLDGGNESLLCENCSDYSLILEGLPEGTHLINASAESLGNETSSSSKSFDVLTSAIFWKELLCPGCKKNKVPASAEIEVRSGVALENGIGSGMFYEFVPKDWVILSLGGSAIDLLSNDGYYILGWNFSGKDFNVSYTVKSPNETLPPKHYYLYSSVSGVEGPKTKVLVGKESQGSSRQVIFNKAGEAMGGFKPVVIKDFDPEIGIDKIIIEARKDISGKPVKVRKMPEKPDYARQLPVEAYRFIEVEDSIRDDDLKSVKIDFRVNKEWLKTRRAETVAMYRYKEGKWNRLPTSLQKDEEGHMGFRAESPGLSLFAIGAEAAIVEEEESEKAIPSIKRKIESLTSLPGVKFLPPFKDIVGMAALLSASALLIFLIARNKNIFKWMRGR
ncbi:MAG: PGF-pre-PGF domain-containing protein [Candidatus Woesearchaeota archaeon]